MSSRSELYGIKKAFENSDIEYFKYLYITLNKILYEGDVFDNQEIFIDRLGNSTDRWYQERLKTAIKFCDDIVSGKTESDFDSLTALLDSMEYFWELKKYDSWKEWVRDEKINFLIDSK